MEESELQQALEQQLDVVLRLEEERLQLLNENKLQKAKIKELINIVSKCSQEIMNKPKVEQKTTQIQTDFYYQPNNDFKNSSTQTETPYENSHLKPQDDNMHHRYDNTHMQDSQLDCYTQLSESNILEDSVFSQQSHNTSIQSDNLIEQAQNLLKKTNEQVYKKPPSSVQKPIQNTSRLPQKQLSLKKSINKENQVKEEIQDYKEQRKQQNEQDIITQEIVNLTRDQNVMRRELKKFEEKVKSKDKEILDQKRLIEVKNDTLEKLRNEIQDLGLLINNDKFKSLRVIEGDLAKCKKDYKNLQYEYENLLQQKNSQDADLKNFRIILEKLTCEYEKVQQQDERNSNFETLNAQISKKLEDMERKLNHKQQEIHLKEEQICEIQRENEKACKEIEYFKNMARSNKEHAEKAIKDIEFYKNMNKQVKQF